MTQAEIKKFYEEQIEWYKKELVWIQEQLDFITKEFKWYKKQYGFVPFQYKEDLNRTRQRYYRNRKHAENQIAKYTKRLATM